MHNDVSREPRTSRKSHLISSNQPCRCQLSFVAFLFLLTTESKVQ